MATGTKRAGRARVTLSKRQEYTGFRLSVEPKGIQEIREMVSLERQMLGWTQQELADEAGLCMYTVSRLERGRTTLWPMRTIVLIFNALGYDVTVSKGR